MPLSQSQLYCPIYCACVQVTGPLARCNIHSHHSLGRIISTKCRHEKSLSRGRRSFFAEFRILASSLSVNDDSGLQAVFLKPFRSSTTQRAREAKNLNYSGLTVFDSCLRRVQSSASSKSIYISEPIDRSDLWCLPSSKPASVQIYAHILVRLHAQRDSGCRNGLFLANMIALPGDASCSHDSHLSRALLCITNVSRELHALPGQFILTSMTSVRAVACLGQFMKVVKGEPRNGPRRQDPAKSACCLGLASLAADLALSTWGSRS